MLQRATPLEVLDYVTSCVRLHLEQLKLRKFEEILRYSKEILSVSVGGKSGTATCSFATSTVPARTMAMAPRTRGT